MKVLLIEDDKESSAYIARGLREQGHVVDLAVTGRDGLFLATDGGHDVLIVDRMLPGLDAIGLGGGGRPPPRKGRWPCPSCSPPLPPPRGPRRSPTRRRCCEPVISKWTS